MHPHIPRPRRKATRTCTDTAGVVRTVHGEFMWPFTARVNEKQHRSNGSLPLQFAAATPAAGFMLHRQTANVRIAGIAADDGTDCHSTWSRAGSATPLLTSCDLLLAHRGLCGGVLCCYGVLKGLTGKIRRNFEDGAGERKGRLIEL